MRTVVAVDGDHLLYSLRTVEQRFDFASLLEFLRRTEGEVVGAFYYLSLDPTEAAAVSLMKVLRRSGWDVRINPVQHRGASTVRAARSYDIQMAVDILRHAESCDKLVLFSGDADFTPVLESLRAKKVLTKVVCLPGAMSSSLRRAADEYQDLTEIEILPEVLDDFVEAAHEFIKKGLKDPAAALLGVRLEKALRNICARRGLALEEADSIDSLSNKLTAAGEYDRLTKKRIIVWGEIRNAATHGVFDRYSQRDVEEMLSWMKLFLKSRSGI